jgi:hypothetical protein
VSKGKDGSAHFSAAIKHTEVGGREKDTETDTQREETERQTRNAFSKKTGGGKGSSTLSKQWL